MKPILFLSLIILMAAACKKSSNTQKPAPVSPTDTTSRVQIPAPTPTQAQIDTFIGTFKTWGQTDAHAEVYVESNRKYAHITGNMALKFWTNLPDKPDYQIKNNAAQASLDIYKTTYDQWWVYIKRPNDSIIINWNHSEEIYAKGPTGGWHTSIDASFSGKRKH